MNTLIGIAIGLILGWNLIPQPAIVKRAYQRVYRHIEHVIARAIERSQGNDRDPE
ncbi:MAG: hypothetical protein ACO1RT_10250 [Planctomycetaceae bacterium]